MATNIPATIKSTELGRFATRAAQVEKAKPIIAYWCHFYIVNQIIEKGLHSIDDEVKRYTTNLVDKLEQFKSEHSDNDTLLDSTAASAYVEQFGLEVFDRADAAMRANKVTKQTADTFQAAATFLELLQVWGPMDPEVAAKVKFAKYHAVRIVKAIKNGEDPNATNPAPREEKMEPELDLNDPEAKAFEASMGPEAARPRQPSVEEIPDEADRVERQMARQSVLDESLHPSRASSIPPQASTSRANLPSAASHEPRPVTHPDVATTEQDPSLELPSAPQTLGSSSSLTLPDTPGSTHLGAPRPHMPPDSLQSFPPPTSVTPSSPPGSSLDASDFYKPPSSMTTSDRPPADSTLRGASAARPHADAPLPPALGRSPAPAPAPAPASTAQPRSTNASTVDDQAITLAQKHARWAVSALTFDDVNTAIKELKNSLRYLGVE